MKKIIVLFFLILFLLFGVGSMSIVLADIHGPNECCRIYHDLTDIASECSKDAIVGPENPLWCDVNDDNNMDTVDGVTLKWGTCCFVDTIYSISDWVFYIFLPLMIVAGFVAGYLLLFSGGDPSQAEKAKSIIFFAVIALIIILLSKIIPSVIKTLIS